jgi:hypothetical protein
MESTVTGPSQPSLLILSERIEALESRVGLQTDQLTRADALQSSFTALTPVLNEIKNRLHQVELSSREEARGIEYLKINFGEGLRAKLEETMKRVESMRYDVEDFRSSIHSFVRQGEMAEIVKRLDTMCPLKTYSSLERKCTEFARKRDIIMVRAKIEKMMDLLRDEYAVRKDVRGELDQIENKHLLLINQKVDLSDFQKRF